MILTKSTDVIKNGTKVVISGMIGIIQGNNTKQCRITGEGLYIDLNYKIKLEDRIINNEILCLTDEFTIYNDEVN
jgi:hypothetical protein